MVIAPFIHVINQQWNYIFLDRLTTKQKSMLILPQALVAQNVDNTIHGINVYSVDSAVIGFPNTYPLDIDLSLA